MMLDNELQWAIYIAVNEWFTCSKYTIWIKRSTSINKILYVKDLIYKTNIITMERLCSIEILWVWIDLWLQKYYLKWMILYRRIY